MRGEGRGESFSIHMSSAARVSLALVLVTYVLDIPVATAIASRGVLGTSMTLPARNIKNPGPGMPASIVLYLLPCKCRTEL